MIFLVFCYQLASHRTSRIIFAYINKHSGLVDLWFESYLRTLCLFVWAARQLSVAQTTAHFGG